jgi:hypothetical protein
MVTIRPFVFTLIVLMGISGCSKIEPIPARGPARWIELPYDWHVGGQLLLTARVSSDGWVYFMPSETKGFAEMNRIRGSEPNLQIDSPRFRNARPPAVRYRAGSMEDVSPAEFAAASGVIVGFANGGPIDDILYRPTQTAVTLERSENKGENRLMFNGRRIDMGYAALKDARKSEDGKYFAVIWTDMKPDTFSIGGQWNIPVYPGEEYLHLIDAQTGRSLGAPIQLEGRKNTLGPFLVWTPESTTVMLADEQMKRIWVFTVDELKQPSPGTPPTHSGANP